MARDIDSDDDMEAGADAVLREELRSSAFGRREDELCLLYTSPSPRD